ncbi:MAG: hypothetical protein J0I21_09875 [Alphaproteobacteria bacterium]|nr:hypothetical protein [Alphaproteobacteria bacterium]
MSALFRSVVMAGLCSLAGCAAHRGESAATPPPAAPAASLGYATIVAARQSGIEGTRILTAIGLTPIGAADGRGEVEFIVRTADGATLSVVQPDRGNLRPGERVVVVGGARTRLIPLADIRGNPGT